jgi:TetR/AcrR family transcriptional repressor of nem operon
MSKAYDTRQTILDMAAMLFHSQSYTAVGVATICNQAGVSKGSFFHFFRSKQELAVAVLDQLLQQINDTLVSRAFSQNLAPLERLDRFVDELYKFQKAMTKQYGHLPGCPFGNMAIEQATQDEVLRGKADRCLDALKARLQQTIEDAIENGDLPPINAPATADAMLGYVEGIQLLAKSRNDPGVIRKLGPAIKTIRVDNTG